LSLDRLLPPSPTSFRDGFSVLLKSVRLKRLYINSRALTEGVQDALNRVAAAAERVRRRGRSSSSSSGSSSRGEADHGDVESNASDYDARDATRAAAAAAMGETVRAWPRFVRTRPRRRVPAKDLIALEVFSIYGWGQEEIPEVTAFVRYLARSAPHLREVGLVTTTASTALALRHAISTSLTGLDLRCVDDLDDVGLATLLRSRTGRRLRSLTVPHMGMFGEEWQYGVLNGTHQRAQSQAQIRAILGSSGSDGDGNTPPPLQSPAAAAANAEGPWRLGAEPRLRHLRRVDLSVLSEERRSVAERLFNGQRVAFTPYAIVPPL
jgi:hypothetical protein